MKRLLRFILTVGSSRVVPPVIIGVFFLFYIGIAFFTDETLIALMAFTARSTILAVLLAVIPLNYLLRMVRESLRYAKMQRAMAGKAEGDIVGLFDEVVELSASRAPDIAGRLEAVGYRTRRHDNVLAAWRGIRLFPVQFFLLAGFFCLFAGILVSITSRTSLRQMVVEGDALPTPDGGGGIVERISLAQSNGTFLSRILNMDISTVNSGSGRKTFGLYPPSMYNGAFVYPRYLGLALHFRFIAPDLSAGYETNCSLNTYPPGKEDNVNIPGSPYRIVFNIPEPEPGTDRYISYMTGHFTLNFKLLKEKEVLFSGTVPAGGEFVRDGFRLTIPDVRRLVVTDFIRDYGVLCIWYAGLFIGLAAIFWLPVRLFFPRRELLVIYGETGTTTVCSRAEGGTRKHAGVFHEALDLIDAAKGIVEKRTGVDES